MKATLQRALVLLAALWLAAPAAVAQKQELTEKDKKKMAEIAQRPEVQQRINEAWDKMREQDMQFAYNVNITTRLGEMIEPQYADYRAKYGRLYDNPMLLQYVNSLGQKLVPKDSPNLYAFRILLDPRPDAISLSTGTIYVTTGLIAMLDNEAQLMYILGHEMAHIERNHYYTKLRNEIVEEEFWKEKEASAQRKRGLFAALATAAGAGIGAAAGGMDAAVWGGLAGAGAGMIAGAAIFRNRFEPTNWETEIENEADAAGFKYSLEQNYDVREVPRLYARLERQVARDARVGLGFMGSPGRVRERTAHIQSLLNSAYKADIDNRLQTGLTATSPNFSLLMAALKRDNGIIAMDYDLFAMARDNLEEAAALRSNDPRVHYYLGRLMAVTGRTPEDRQQAIAYFTKAMQYDAARGAYADPHLDNAIHLMAQNDPAMTPQIVEELKTYVALYQRENAGRLPNNMHILYDYAALVGEDAWYVPPSMIVSTKNVEAVYVTPVAAAPATTADAVMGRATGRMPEQPVPLAPPPAPASSTAETKPPSQQ